MTNPSLPQRDDAAARAERARALAWARTQYTWAHSHTYEVSGKQLVLEPIAVLEVDDEHPLPKNQGLDIVQIVDLAGKLLEIVANIILKVTSLIDVGAVALDPPPPASFSASGPPKAKGVLDKLREAGEHALDVLEEAGEHALDDVKHKLGLVEDAGELAGAVGFLAKLREHHEDLQELLSKAQPAVAGRGGKSTKDLSDGLVDIAKQLFEELTKDAVEELLTKAGLSGRAQSIHDYAAQFQTIVVPDVVASTLTDELFARMRIAGPNPLMIAKIDALPASFPVDPQRFEALTGSALAAALASGRVFLVDYARLRDVVGGTFPAGQKYSCAPLALFVLDETRRALRPIAIQCNQEPSNANPVFYPDDGESWTLAKLHVQMADGNVHELVSHLGLTHLLVEPFVVATHRQLAQQHPLYLLLLPHFQGTLFINNAAILSLIAPGGAVDKLLAGTIESDWKVTASALLELDFNAHMLPAELAARGVDDPSVLPSYPYRDDALLVWDAIGKWVRDYLGLYYGDDADVVGDPELQAWFQDLVSAQGGAVRGLGEPGPDGGAGLYTFDYLAKVVTMVIFTGSAQHASVNFPQLGIMSYTPAMPLATYAPPPSQSSGLPADAMLDHLPPLQMALIQLVVGQLLGGVYFTRLGDYDRHQREPWFQDPRVTEPLEAFQASLDRVEHTIGARNLERPTYQPLLPSRIPQSINI